jgi:DNA gyrase subunit A
MVSDEDQVILVTDRGKVIRIRMTDVRVIGRNTQGVRLIECEEGERVSSVARLAEAEEEKNGEGDAANGVGSDTDAAADPESTDDGGEDGDGGP